MFSGESKVTAVTGLEGIVDDGLVAAGVVVKEGASIAVVDTAARCYRVWGDSGSGVTRLVRTSDGTEASIMT